MQQDSYTSQNEYTNVRGDPVPILYPAGLLFVLTIVAQMISLGFGRLDAEQSFSQIVIPSLLALGVVTVPACYFGMALGRRINLGVTQFDDLLAKRPRVMQDIARGLAVATLLGLGLGAALLILRLLTESFLPPELPQLGFRGAVGGLAVSLGAAVAEEVWFRLGLMTLLVWSITRLRGEQSAAPSVVWAVIILSAFAFAAAHIPQLAAHGAGSFVGVSSTLFGNVLVGTLYGWLYWRRGILAAIVAHFSVDLVLHVLSVFIW